MSHSTLIHASAVVAEGVGCLFMGASGTGKSTLCIELINQGARLIGDDQLILESQGEKLYARSPSNIKGKIECWGMGIMDLPASFIETEVVPISLLFELGHVSEREGKQTFITLCGLSLEVYQLSTSHHALAAQIQLLAKTYAASNPLQQNILAC